MGGLVVTETIIEYAPVALNLLGNLIKWLNEDSSLMLAASKGRKSGAGRTTMRRGVLTTAPKLSDDDNGDMQNLEDDLASTVRGSFMTQYGYAYNGAASFPPSAQKDQNGNPVKLVPGEDFTTCAANSAASIQSYINSNIVNDNMPAWAQGTLRNDLIGALTTLLSGQTTDGWITSPQPKTVTGGANNETLQADIILLYCVTQAPDPKNQGQNVKTLFCKYIGVYYLGTSWGLSNGVGGKPAIAPAAGSDGVQVLDVECAVGAATLAKALGSQIVRTQPDGVNTITTVRGDKLSFVVAAEGATRDSPSVAPAKAMPIEWFVCLLEDNGVKYTQTLRSATKDECAEFAYLDRWDQLLEFKKGDFSSVQY
ncbi:hypothetical protein MKEN_00622700 [Mycena kentingensis (nom. inval.)]|nr:hypothetical protein MKEN_00622700 [Mycena kentingensis (nom. inval.)]